MNSLFGDASTVMGTPSIQADNESLMRTGSPGPSRDLPPLNLDTGDMDDDPKSQIQTSGGEDRSVGGWLSRVVTRGRSPSISSGRQGRYVPLGQQDDGGRNN
ncbi:hypothetical protein E4U17_001822 [Claviceps sp. LM77 group G4]|nr:hypothetical protein E4U17_001822 [Claviceps sp. LM77 group G4]